MRIRDIVETLFMTLNAVTHLLSPAVTSVLQLVASLLLLYFHHTYKSANTGYYAFEVLYK